MKGPYPSHDDWWSPDPYDDDFEVDDNDESDTDWLYGDDDM